MPARSAGETIHQWVFRGLRRAIMSGAFPPGQAVTIRGLAEAMEVSAMPVREALRRLVAERALTLLDNRRVRVPQMTPERFEELYAARTALEVEAASRALPLVDAARLEKLRAIDQTINAAILSGDSETVVAQNFLFHLTLYSARRDSVLVPLIESVWLQTGPFMRAALEAFPTAADGYDYHLAALDAIAAGDEAALRQAIAHDIRTGIGHLALSGKLIAVAA
ncbi:GntR family transcriptional regulator [Acidisoma cellulosilytica]|uniref:GntR family transcriptional regulator n=2 Tax=Acidisoma cellulosilyticum TaxID=2802395 RepID=A0A963YZZ0_9PROT|nr:GntR family transcriptional regulator [Acidisoma cellulosilyticum]